MKNIKWPVGLATFYLLIYTLMAQITALQFLVPWLFLFSPVVVIWMVVRVLKDGEESKKTFDEAFYDHY